MQIKRLQIDDYLCLVDFDIVFDTVSGGSSTILIGENGAGKSTMIECILNIATVYKGNIIKNLIMDCQSYTKYRPNETTGGIFVSWRRKEELPTGA